MANSFDNPIVIDTAMTQDAGLGRPLKVTSIAVVTATAGLVQINDASSSSNPLFIQQAGANPAVTSFGVPQVWKTFVVSTFPAGAKVVIYHR